MSKGEQSVDILMSSMEAKFAALESEWITVCNSVSEDVAGWEQQLEKLVNEEAKLRDVL